MTIITNPALLATIKSLLADPRLEFPTTQAVNKITGATETKPYGFTGKQQATVMLMLLIEVGFAPDNMTAQDFTQALEIIMNLGNASAARQAFEKCGLLAETPGGGKKSATAEQLASKFTDIFRKAQAATAPVEPAPAQP